MTFGRGLNQSTMRGLDQVEKVQRRTRLRLVDGSEVEGRIHVGKLHRVLDFLNQEGTLFIPVTDAVTVVQGRTERVEFLAVAKAHVVSVSELDD